MTVQKYRLMLDAYYRNGELPKTKKQDTVPSGDKRNKKATLAPKNASQAAEWARGLGGVSLAEFQKGRNADISLFDDDDEPLLGMGSLEEDESQEKPRKNSEKTQKRQKKI